MTAATKKQNKTKNAEVGIEQELANGCSRVQYKLVFAPSHMGRGGGANLQETDSGSSTCSDTRQNNVVLDNEA